MNNGDEFVNEIMNVNEKSSNYIMKKYKNSLDYEKLNSEDYLNYKLREKITHFLIPLNLNSVLIDKIFFLTKKFKSKIKENKLIPIVSYVAVQESGLNISPNELFKKLKLKKAWYIKYAKYIRSNGADFNELFYPKKNKKKNHKKIKDNDLNKEIVIYSEKDKNDFATIPEKHINLEGIKTLNLETKVNIKINNHNSIERARSEKSILESIFRINMSVHLF